MASIRRTAAFLQTLPVHHPLALKIGPYHWSAERLHTVRRMLKAICARSAGYTGVGGMCAALSDTPGSGKTVTLKLVMTFAALMFPRVVPFYHDYRDGAALPSVLYKAAYSARFGRAPAAAEADLCAVSHAHAVPVAFLDEVLCCVLGFVCRDTRHRLTGLPACTGSFDVAAARTC